MISSRVYINPGWLNRLQHQKNYPKIISRDLDEIIPQYRPNLDLARLSKIPISSSLTQDISSTIVHPSPDKGSPKIMRQRRGARSSEGGADFAEPLKLEPQTYCQNQMFPGVVVRLIFIKNVSFMQISQKITFTKLTPKLPNTIINFLVVSSAP